MTRKNSNKTQAITSYILKPFLSLTYMTKSTLLEK